MGVKHGQFHSGEVFLDTLSLTYIGIKLTIMPVKFRKAIVTISYFTIHGWYKPANYMSGLPMLYQHYLKYV